MINYYHIICHHDGTATLVDERDQRQWTFAGGYEPTVRLVTQFGCERIAQWLGERTSYPGSVIAALDEASRD